MTEYNDVQHSVNDGPKTLILDPDFAFILVFDFAFDWLLWSPSINVAAVTHCRYLCDCLIQERIFHFLESKITKIRKGNRTIWENRRMGRKIYNIYSTRICYHLFIEWEKDDKPYSPFRSSVSFLVSLLFS